MNRKAHNKLPAGEAALNKIIYDYKRSAIARGYSWELTTEQAKALMRGRCHYCGSTGGKFGSTAKRMNGMFSGVGIDRLDNSTGYTPANCRPCCKVCNRAKNVMTVGEFLDWISGLVEYRCKKR